MLSIYCAKLGLAVTLLFASLLAFAGEEQVPCPSIEKVKQGVQGMDTLTQYSDTKYDVYGGGMFDDASGWWEVVAGAIAPDFNTAFTVAQTSVKNVVNPKSIFAEDQGFFYACQYVENTGAANVVALKFKDEKNALKKAISKLHS